MTVPPVIPASSAQPAAKSRPSGASDDPAKSFLSYLRSSTDKGGSDALLSDKVLEGAVKADTNEKQTGKKTDKDQVADTIAAPGSVPMEQPAAFLPITALLGLPAVPKTDTVETGKTADSEGKAALSPPAGGPDSTTQSDALKNNPLVFAKPQQKVDKPQSVDAAVRPADASNPITLPVLNTSPNSGKEADPGNTISAASDSAANKSNVEALAAGAPPSASVPTAPPSNLAFALRLSEVSMDSASQQRPPQALTAEPIAGSTPVSSPDLATAVQAAAGSQLKEQSQQHDGNTGAPPYDVPQMHQHQQNVSETPSSSGEQEARTTAAQLPAHQEIANSEPVRNLHMQVIGDNNSRVDVRLMDRGGELHVSVKSSDTNLAQNLQDHMPELTSRLEQQKLQAEVWIPKIADNGKPETSGARDFSSGGNNHSNNSSHSDQQGKKQQRYQPDWVDVLENSTQGTGKIKPTWLQ